MADSDALRELAQKLKGGHLPTGVDVDLILTHPESMLPLLFEKFKTPNGFQFAAMMVAGLHRQPNRPDPPGRDIVRRHAVALCAGADLSLICIGMQLLPAFQEDPSVGQVLRGKVADSNPHLRVGAMREYMMWTLTGPKSEEELQYLLGVSRDPLLALAQIAGEIVRDKYENPGPLRDVVLKRNKPLGGVDDAVEVLRGGNVFETGKAFSELERRGQRAIPPMLALMEETANKKLKEEIHHSISRMGGGGSAPRKEVVDALLRGADSRDPATSRHCAHLLHLYAGDSRAREKVVSLAENASDVHVRLSAINDLTAKWAAPHIPLLLKFLEDHDSQVRIYAAVVLARHGNSSGYALALEAVRDAIRTVKDGGQAHMGNMRLALQTLGRVGSPADVPLLDAFVGLGTRFNSLDAREAIWEIELREASAEGRELEYLQRRYEAGAIDWASTRLLTRANERQSAEVLFSVMKSSKADGRVRQEALSRLLNGGWLEPRVAGLETAAYKLRERPPANPAGAVVGFILRAFEVGLRWRRS
ncbi:HEAT repeat domain-containing protein [bacterium]|nr:MAG: HEAT repeat domain-containing protein [bacterium]